LCGPGDERFRAASAIPVLEDDEPEGLPVRTLGARVAENSTARSTSGGTGSSR
jgi:hypothetical protein